MNVAKPSLGDERQPRPGSRMARAIRATVLVGLLGTVVDLLLLGHTDGALQLEPLVVLGMSIGVTTWRLADRAGLSSIPFRVCMLLNIASGGVGVLLHYRGNVGFELEMSPGMSGWELFAQAMTGATPALAPGAMVLVGVIGMIAEMESMGTRRYQNAVVGEPDRMPAQPSTQEPRQ